jgi:hypothetical protein
MGEVSSIREQIRAIRAIRESHHRAKRAHLASACILPCLPRLRYTSDGQTREIEIPSSEASCIREKIRAIRAIRESHHRAKRAHLASACILPCLPRLR